MEKGGLLPFDIRDPRCGYYDLKPRPLEEKLYVNEIIGHVRSLEAANWKTTSPIDGYVCLKVREEQDVKFFTKSMDFGTHDTWLELIHQSRDVCELMGITLGVWKRGKGFARDLAKKAQDGTRVRILTNARGESCFAGIDQPSPNTARSATAPMTRLSTP